MPEITHTYLTVPKRSCYSLKQNNHNNKTGLSKSPRSQSPINKPYFRSISEPKTKIIMSQLNNSNNSNGNNSRNSQPRKFQEKINMQNNRMAEQERAVQEALGFTKMLKGNKTNSNNSGNNQTNGNNGHSGIPVAGMAPNIHNIPPSFQSNFPHPPVPPHHPIGLVPPEYHNLSRSDPNLAFWQQQQQQQQMLRHQQHMIALQNMHFQQHQIPPPPFPHFHQNSNNNNNPNFQNNQKFNNFQSNNLQTPNNTNNLASSMPDLQKTANSPIFSSNSPIPPSSNNNSLTVQTNTPQNNNNNNLTALQAPISPYGTSPNNSSNHSPMAPSSPSRSHPYNSPNCHRRSNSMKDNNNGRKSPFSENNSNFFNNSLNSQNPAPPTSGNLTLPKEFNLNTLNFASSTQSSRRSSISSEGGNNLLHYSPINVAAVGNDNGLNSMPHSPNGGGKITRKTTSLKERQQSKESQGRSGHTTPGTPGISRKSLVTNDNNLLNHSLSTPGSPNCMVTDENSSFRPNVSMRKNRI